MVVVLIHPAVQLFKSSEHGACCRDASCTHQIQDRHFHHALIEVRCPVLDNLDCDNLLRFQVLTLDDLPKRTLTQHVKNQVAVLVVRLLIPKYVVNVKYVVTVFVVISVILTALRWFREHPPRISRAFVLEVVITYAIRGG